MDESTLKLYWKMNYFSSCVSTPSAGVITLYDNSFTCLDIYKDNAGRLANAVLTKDDEKLIVVIVYVPCDPVAALAFMESVYCLSAGSGKVLRQQKVNSIF